MYIIYNVNAVDLALVNSVVCKICIVETIIIYYVYYSIKGPVVL